MQQVRDGRYERRIWFPELYSLMPQQWASGRVSFMTVWRQAHYIYQSSKEISPNKITEKDNLGGRHLAERKHMGTILFGSNTLYINFVYLCSICRIQYFNKGCLLPWTDGMVFMKELWLLEGIPCWKKKSNRGPWEGLMRGACMCDTETAVLGEDMAESYERRKGKKWYSGGEI